MPQVRKSLHSRGNVAGFGTRALFVVVPLSALFLLVALLVRRLVLRLRSEASSSRVWC
jgi:hypothetical protein